MSYRARWSGQLFEAALEQREDGVWVRLLSDVPAQGFVALEADRHVRAVPAAECESVEFVTVVCRWRDEPFLVYGEREGELLLQYTGARVTVARRLGLERAERGVWRRWVAAAEIEGLHERAALLDL
ncbi:hypothetical protein OIE66_15785 [Nonomuraea sp. NBC_01738]|uniref:hypothetical protein n=1 Tax=Nonomuraea sp. NBC_01738 TaxID=2976003 RepID=UPI002E129D4F|nr:hypothetical protein OIE66_15785 [Nonomuraea sp. NBC_01738]